MLFIFDYAGNIIFIQIIKQLESFPTYFSFLFPSLAFLMLCFLFFTFFNSYSIIFNRDF